jgi:hypothetical protein
MSKSGTVASMGARRRRPDAAEPERLLQSNPFCFAALRDAPVSHLDLSQTISNVMDGLRFLTEGRGDASVVEMSDAAEHGRALFLEALYDALDYAQNQRAELERQGKTPHETATEVAHG